MSSRNRLLGQRFATGLLAAMIGAGPLTLDVRAQGHLRIGMTANDVPLTWGQPDNGFEGYRTPGLMIYDSLVNFDLTSADKPSGLIPGLAESWEVSKADPTKWTFKLRRGVKFHDGSEFNADAVIFNIDRLFNDKAPQYSARMVSLTNFRLPAYKSVKKVDDYTIEFETKSTDAFWPYQICYVLFASPKQWEATGKDWAKFAENPSGTGPWKLTALKARELAELVPNKDHWDKSRVPKLDKVTLIPMPDPSARTAALLSGQVDWIEAPSPDAMNRIKSSGFEIVSNIYPHIWSWHLNRVEGSPWNDIRVRKAANLAIDRKGVVELLGGYGVEATGHVPKGRSLVRDAVICAEDRCRGCKEVAGRGRLQRAETGQSQNAHLGLGFGADATTPDERVYTAESEGGRH